MSELLNCSAFERALVVETMFLQYPRLSDRSVKLVGSIFSSARVASGLKNISAQLCSSGESFLFRELNKRVALRWHSTLVF